MLDGLYQVTTAHFCAGFVVKDGKVAQCAPILRKRLPHWIKQAVPITTKGVGMSLFGKLAAVTAELGYVPKRGRNTFHNYDYVTEGDLVDAVRAKLAEKGVAYLFSVDSAEVRATDAKGGPITTVSGTVTFADGETNEQASINVMGSGQDAGDKGLYKAITGAQKYALMKTFLIPTGDDPEADEKTDKANAKTTKASASTDPEKSVGQDAQPHTKKAGVTPAQDPQERVIPAGKFKDRKVGSLSLAEAEEIFVKLPNTHEFVGPVKARIDTLKALATQPTEVQTALAGLDLEVAK